MPNKRKAAGKKEAVSVPRLKVGMYVAMDRSGQLCVYKKRPVVSAVLSDWDSVDGNWGFVMREFLTGLPHIPKSQWDKVLYRVGKNGALVRVDIS